MMVIIMKLYFLIMKCLRLFSTVTNPCPLMYRIMCRFCGPPLSSDMRFLKSEFYVQDIIIYIVAVL